jgi:hypothetical protein
MFPGRRTRAVMAVKSTVLYVATEAKKKVVTGLIKKPDGALIDAPEPCAKGLGPWQANDLMCDR